MGKLVAALIWALPLVAQQVEERSGEIFFVAKGGESFQVTTGARDTEPVLSPNGLFIVFFRVTSQPVEGPFGTIAGNEVCAAQDFRENQRPLIYCRSVGGIDRLLSGFSRLQWSLDNKNAYFLAKYGVDTGALCRLSIETRKTYFVSAAHQFAVVQSGPWRGFPVADVLTWVKAEDGLEHPSAPFFVLTPQGIKQDRAGEQGEDFQDVLARLEQTRQ